MAWLAQPPPPLLLRPARSNALSPPSWKRGHGGFSFRTTSPRQPSPESEAAPSWSWLQVRPFHAAGPPRGLLTGALGGLLGSFSCCAKFSSFSDAWATASLPRLTIGILLGSIPPGV